MGVPKKIKKDISISPEKTLMGRREELLDEITKKGTFLPKSVLYEDLDLGFITFVKENLRTVVNGEDIPVIDILMTTQNWAQFTETWRFQNMDNNPEPPFITIVRKREPKFGSNPALRYNIPNRKDYFYAAVPTWDGTRKGMDIYTIPQPIPQDIDYSVKIISTRLRELNEFNKNVQREFASRQAYARVKGHFIPIVMNGEISDESVMEVEKRKYFIQSFNFNLQGFLIDEDEFEVKPAISRTLALTEIDEDVPIEGRRIRKQKEYKEKVFKCERAELWINGQEINVIDEPCGKIIDFRVIDDTGVNTGQLSGNTWVVPNSCLSFIITINSDNEITILNPCSSDYDLRIADTLNNNVGQIGGSGLWVVNNSTVNIENSTGGTLYNLSIPAEGNENQIINDSTVNIYDTTGGTLYNLSIPAEGNENQIINDSTVHILNSIGGTLYNVNVNAEGTANQTITDSTEIIKNSTGGTLYTDSIVAEGSNTRTIGDSINNIYFDSTLLFSATIPAESTGVTNLDCSTGLGILRVEGANFITEVNKIYYYNNLSGQWETSDGKYFIFQEVGGKFRLVDNDYKLLYQSAPTSYPSWPWEATSWGPESLVVTQLTIGTYCGSCPSGTTITINDEAFTGITECNINIPVVDSSNTEIGHIDIGEIPIWVVDDTLLKVKNSTGGTLYITAIKAGTAIYDQTITDSTEIIKNSTGGTLYTDTIVAQGSKTRTITDSTEVIKNSTGGTLYTDTIVAQGSKTRTITDSTEVIKNSTGGTLYTDTIVAQGSKTRTINDSATKIYNTTGGTLTATISVPAEGTKNIYLSDYCVGGGGGSNEVIFSLWGSEERSAKYTTSTGMTLTYDSDDGSSGTWSYAINGGSWTSVGSPISLSTSEYIQMKRTTYGSDGWIKFTY